jgi:ABC-2 type transport system ATP-binding protein
MPVIEAEDLTKRYGAHAAVDGISFSVSKGQIFGLLGPNGSGKTTTMGMLLGVTAPTSGSVRLFGQADAAALQRARRRVGATLETPNFYPYLSASDNLRLVANLKGLGGRHVDAALDAAGLLARRKDAVEGYSLGMKQRLALAAALLGDPDVIVLDEPANGLDPDGARQLRETLTGLAAAGRTVLLSSHLLHEVERTCTHVAIMRRGRIVRQGSMESVLERAAVDARLGREASAREPLTLEDVFMHATRGDDVPLASVSDGGGLV